MPRNWTTTAARANLSALLRQACEEGPQTITRRGRAVAVVVSTADWERSTRRGSLAEFFASSPLPGSGLLVERVKDLPPSRFE